MRILGRVYHYTTRDVGNCPIVDHGLYRRTLGAASTRNSGPSTQLNGGRTVPVTPFEPLNQWLLSLRRLKI